MVAAEQGNLEIVQELIRRGANVNFDDVVSKHTYMSKTTPYEHTPTPTSACDVVDLWIELWRKRENPGTGEKQCGHLNHSIHLTKMT